jgi:hypothetical protein
VSYSPVTQDQFRADFPEFENESAYPPSALTFWFNVASIMLSPRRWSTAPSGSDPNNPGPCALDIGTELFVAHNLTLERQAALSAQLSAQDGLPGPAGVSTGAVAGTSVGPVSVSYDSNAGLDTGAGHWNLTIYGTRFSRLARFAGKGGHQANRGCWGWPGQIGGWW